MCGIAGIVRRDDGNVSLGALGRMAAAIRHRGPDGYGFYLGRRVGFAHVRLSIVDLAGGAQPMTNEDGTVTITYNGEVYNHVEIRRELEALGHRFRTSCDTEVLVHGYEQWGADLLPRLNGQFAFAIHDSRRERVFFARDRFGVRPLFIARAGNALYFASEAKAIFATGEVRPELDPAGLDETFTFWAPRPPRTAFRNVQSLEPGTWAEWHDGTLRSHRYYQLDYREAVSEPADALDQLDALLRDSVQLRLRADVPVGAYISGGLDSAITAMLAAAESPFTLRSFSITFDDPRFDEREHQLAVAERVRSLHAVADIRVGAIAESFPTAVWHAEAPLLRTAPVPMEQLAAVTRGGDIKVVLTGEGADELFLGYDLFKEVSVRRFCLRNPSSRSRRLLFGRLYPWLDTKKGNDFWVRSFLDAGAANDPLFSHMPRFLLTSRIKEFYSPEFRETLGGFNALQELRESLPPAFIGWSDLNRAAYLEMLTLLSPYLLSTQGDRMAMAHGVEGRFPFLDHRLFEFAASLPTGSRLRGLREKEILKRWARRHIPVSVLQRPKQPYRAPDAPAFFASGAPAWVAEALSPERLRECGVFAEDAIAALARRCKNPQFVGAREGQAIVAVLSTQLLHEHCTSPATVSPLDPDNADVILRVDASSPHELSDIHA